MIVTAMVETYIMIVVMTMSSAIRFIMIRLGEIEVVMVHIHQVNTKSPGIIGYKKRTEEVFPIHKLMILSCCKYPPEVIVPIIQVTIIIIQSPFVPIQHFIHYIAHLVYKIVIDFIHIIILPCRKVQLVGHLVGQETGFFAQTAITHCGTAIYSAHYQRNQYKKYSFHDKVVFSSSTCTAYSLLISMAKLTK